MTSRVYADSDAAEASQTGKLLYDSYDSDNLIKFARYFMEHIDSKKSWSLLSWIRQLLEARHLGVDHSIFNKRLTKYELSNLYEICSFLSCNFKFDPKIAFVEEAIQTEFSSLNLNLTELTKEFNKLNLQVEGNDCNDINDFVAEVNHGIAGANQAVTKFLIETTGLILATIIDKVSSLGYPAKLEYVRLFVNSGQIVFGFHINDILGEFNLSNAIWNLKSTDLLKIASGGLDAFINEPFSGAGKFLMFNYGYYHVNSFIDLFKTLVNLLKY